MRESRQRSEGLFIYRYRRLPGFTESTLRHVHVMGKRGKLPAERRTSVGLRRRQAWARFTVGTAPSADGVKDQCERREHGSRSPLLDDPSCASFWADGTCSICGPGLPVIAPRTPPTSLVAQVASQLTRLARFSRRGNDTRAREHNKPCRTNSATTLPFASLSYHAEATHHDV
jgi:hypothetical protein